MRLTRSDRIRIESLRHQDRLLRKQIIRILNPLQDGVRMLKLDRALQHVQAGRADWAPDGTAIIFRVKAVERAVRQYEADRYIHARMATMKEMRGVPVLRASELLRKR